MKAWKIIAEIAITLSIATAILYYSGRPPADAPAYDKVQEFEVEKLDGSLLKSGDLQKKTAFVFWATWCGPCKVELARLQRLVSNGSLPAESIVAVSMGETRAVVREAARDRGYTFLVGLDKNNLASRHYSINVTPTILFRNTDGTVAWRTSGISPSLEIRALQFLK